MHAFILAGGFATRLWPLTEKRAKPLLPLAGKPIITHIVEKIPKDIPITVSTNMVFEEGFENWKNEIGRENIEILIEDTASDDHKLGALGAVSKWIQDASIDEDVLLLTGDNYFGFEISDFLKAYKSETPLLAAFDIKSKEKAKSFGTVVLKQSTINHQPSTSYIEAFEEKPQEPKSTLVSTGCSIIPKKILPILVKYARRKPDNVGGIFEELLRQDIKVECYKFTEPWFDIGSFEAYLSATNELVGNQIVIEDGASCEETECQGSVVIGPNSKVRNSNLKNAVLFENCEVSDCDLTNCIIDCDCELKNIDLNGKMLRENTRLMD